MAVVQAIARHIVDIHKPGGVVEASRTVPFTTGETEPPVGAVSVLALCCDGMLFVSFCRYLCIHCFLFFSRLIALSHIEPLMIWRYLLFHEEQLRRYIRFARRMNPIIEPEGKKVSQSGPPMYFGLFN